MTRQSILLAAAVMLALSQGAFAHGEDSKSATVKSFDPSKVEETAFGREGDPKKVARTILVDMSDTMRFSPADISVRRGETVKFIAANKGQVLHEMVIGTADELKRHAAEMRKSPEMEHDEAYMAHVMPGKRGEIVWQFTKAGQFQFACLIPGHFEVGMVGKVTVK